MSVATSHAFFVTKRKERHIIEYDFKRLYDSKK